jgi:putative phage-type endonuclease
VPVGWFEAGSAEWHAARRNGVGGSEVAALLGISPFESRFSLWHRKKGLIEPTGESAEMYWGKRHEPTICEEFNILRQPDGMWAAPAGTYHASGRPWQIANPDRLVYPDRNSQTPIAVFEAKTARNGDAWGEEGTDEVPVYYRAQAIWYCDALGLPECHIGVLIAGCEYREYLVRWDADEAAMMRAAAEEFIDTLQRNERPPIDGHDATYEVMKLLPDGVEDFDVEVAAALRDRYFAALAAHKEAEWELKECRSLLLDAIGNGRRAVVSKTRDLVATRAVTPTGATKSLQPARKRHAA